MTDPLKILMLEDNANDVEIIQRLLRKENPLYEYHVAMNRDQYILGLEQFMPDLILSDNTLPQFNATEALDIFRQKTLHIPFILVTGTVSEEFAAGIIKLGADDYILKDRLTRLPAAIDNALNQKRIEKERWEAVQKLKQSEENLSAIFENASEGFILTDRNYIVKTFNENAKRYMFLKSFGELTVGENIFRFIPPSRTTIVSEMFLKVLAGQKIHYDLKFGLDATDLVWLHFSLTPVWENKRINGICFTIRDITERKEAEDNQRAMEMEILNQKVHEQKKITIAIINAEEKERNRIGQELHDNVNQILAGTKIFLHRAGKDNARLNELIRYPLELLDTCMDEIRLLSHKHVTPVKNIPLKELVQSLLDDLEKNAKIETHFVFDVQQNMGDDLNINLYRIIQEHVNNIIKHAQARKIMVSLKVNDSQITLIVTDDGRGFNIQQKRKGIGISNIINRVESFDGTVAIESSPNNGCTTKISIPVQYK